VFLTIALIVGSIALAAWLVYAAPRLLGPRLTEWRTALTTAREARRAAIRRDPADATRTFSAQTAPRRLRREQRTAAAEGKVQAATAQVTRRLGAFPGGTEPKQKAVIVTMILFVLWTISIVAHGFIEFPMIMSVSGGHPGFGLLGTLLALMVPAIASLGVAHVMRLRRKQRMGPLVSAAAIAGILAVFVALVVYLASLAPIRAEAEYGQQILEAQQQVALLREREDDGLAFDYATLEVERLQTAKEQSVQWNQALVPIAAGSEFATSFVLPSAIALFALWLAQSKQAPAARALDRARNRQARGQTADYRRLSRIFRRAGVSQERLQAAVGGIGGGPAAPVAPGGAAQPAAAHPAPAHPVGMQPPVGRPQDVPPAATVVAPRPTPAATVAPVPTVVIPTPAVAPIAAAPTPTPTRTTTITDDSFDLS
jgi:hypothetical protein